MPTASASLIWLFAGLSLFVAMAFPLGVFWAERRLGAARPLARRNAALAASGTAVWLLVTGILAASGSLRFDKMPPTAMLAILVMWALALVIGLSRVGERLALGLPLAALVGVHGFRLPLELLMHRAYAEGVMPVQMSYSGWNLDILTGTSALLMAVLIASGRMPLRGVRIWNWMGLALLMNIVMISMLSTPTPLRVFSNEPANVWITEAPFVWLPMVMVMTALIGHILLFRRLRKEDARGPRRPIDTGDRDDRPILVTGATGTVGKEVVRALLERGARVRVLVRSLDRVAHLPPQVERVVGDLREPASLRMAMRGVSAALYVSPHEADELQLAENFFSTCEAMAVRLIFAGVHVEIGGRRTSRLVQWYFGRKFPHYVTRFRIGERARTSSADPIVLMPGTFAQNDEIFRDELLQGRFVQPLRGVNMVDVRDVGDAAARVLMDPSFPSGAYPVSGPSHVSGPECAAIWSRALGMEVRYEGDDLPAYAVLLEQKLHGRKLEDFLKTFGVLATMRMPRPSAREIERTAQLLGRQPRSYEEYVEETAAEWGVGIGSEPGWQQSAAGS